MDLRYGSMRDNGDGPQTTSNLQNEKLCVRQRRESDIANSNKKSDRMVCPSVDSHSHGNANINSFCSPPTLVLVGLIAISHVNWV